MALIHWKQIDGDLTGANVLTGSLYISGSINVEALNGINSFTGSFQNSGSIGNTGSFSNQSGSFTIELDGDQNAFNVNVAGETEISVTKEGVFKLKEKDVAPAAVSGGMFFSSSDDYFLGFKN